MTDVTTLGQLAADGRLVFNDGYRTKQAELGEPGIPILRVAEVLDGTIVPALGDQIREEYRSVIGAKASQLGDVVVTTKGTVGRVAQIREGMTQFVYAPQLCFFRATSTSGVDAGFLYQWFRGREFRDQAAGVQSQTDMAPYINLSDLRAMTISLPARVEQRAIAEILGALDDKIESNSRAAGNVDDVVRLEVSASTTNAVEHGSTTTVRLGALADNIRNGVVPQDAAGRPYVSLEHMPRGRLLVDDWGVGDSVASQKWAFERGDVLFGKLRPYFKKVGLVPVDGVCSTDILVLRPRTADVLPILLATLASDEVIEFASSASTGTRMPRASWERIATWEVDLPSEPELSELSDIVEPMLHLGLRLILESRVLAALRDALLPELLSGRLRVPEARERIEAVV